MEGPRSKAGYGSVQIITDPHPNYPDLEHWLLDNVKRPFGMNFTWINDWWLWSIRMLLLLSIRGKRAWQTTRLILRSTSSRPGMNTLLNSNVVSNRFLQCCGSGMFIPDPGSWFLPIPDPGSKNSNKRQGWKIFFVKPFFVATNFTKMNIILFLMCGRKKFGPIFQELLKFLPKKLSPSPQKYGFGIRDPGSEIRDPEITYSGSRIQGSKRHRIPDPQHWVSGSGSCFLL